MKSNLRILPIAACATFLAASASASIVLPLDASVTSGVPYRFGVTLGETDSATISRHVGAWSWEDNDLFNAGAGAPPVGWTHTSDWVALSLTQTTQFTLRLERDANVPWPDALDPNRLASIASMFPSFTIWGGQDTNGGQSHTYTNRGNIAWAEGLSFLAFVDNSTQTSVERTWVLPAGNYSIALGSNAPAQDLDRQGYRATFQTVPEPATAALLLCAAPVFLRRRR